MPSSDNYPELTPDTESYVVDRIVKMLLEYDPKILVYNEEVESPAGFPCVTIEEYNSYSHKQTLTGDNVERYIHVSYQVNVYSILKDGKRQCKQIMGLIDREMRAIGFLRTYSAPEKNMQRNIFRRVARFNGIIDTVNGLVYKSVYFVDE